MIRPLRNRRLLLWLLFFCLIFTALLLVGNRPGPRLRRASASLQAQGALPGLSAETIHDLLTSMDPVSASIDRLEKPAGYTGTSSDSRLLFAQIADGAVPGTSRFMQTTVILVNDSTYASAGTLSFYDDNGAPLTVKIGSTSASNFPVSLGAGKATRLATSGTGALKVGWAALRTDQPVSGTSSFSVRDLAGHVFTDVGVSEAMLNEGFTLFADSMGAADTGIALINPDAAAALELQVDLINSAGAVVRTKALQLAPHGHLARYLTELFRDVGGIQEFEGSLRITADRPFGGTTLRSVGSILTSVPMIPDPGEVLLSNQLYFPHIADGAGSGLTIRTAVLLFNNRDQAVSGTLEFVSSNGSPMTLKIGSQRASSFDYTLAPRAVKRILTSGEGAVKAGWAQFTADGHIAGAVVFQILNSSGVPVTEVGVNDASALETVNLVADTLGSARTGFAIANPGSDETDVRFSLYTKTGSLTAQKDITFAAASHSSQFIDELFREVSGITEFEGWVTVTGDDPIIVLTLRQVDTLTTSMPTLSPVHGFAPTSVLSFAENLTGTAPLVRWQLEQPGPDLGLDELEISCPSCGFDAGDLTPKGEIGYGFYRLQYGSTPVGGGVVKIVLSGTGKNSFDMIGAGTAAAPGSIIASGTLSGSTSGGFKLKLGPNSLKPMTWNRQVTLGFDLLLRDGMIRAPASAGQSTITTTSFSAPGKEEDTSARIRHVSTQRQSFVAASAGAPRLTSTRPPLLRPGEMLSLRGSGFPADAAVAFESYEGEAIEVPGRLQGADLLCGVPPAARPGSIRVLSSSTASNPLWMASPFSPYMTLSRLGSSGAATFGLRFHMEKAEMQLVVQEWRATLLNINTSFGGLTRGRKVGGWTSSGDATQSLDVLVDAVAAARLDLAVGDDVDDPEARVIVERLADGNWAVSYTRVDDGVAPEIEAGTTTIELQLSGVAFSQPSANILPAFQAFVTSVASLPSGEGTGLVARQGLSVF